MKLRIEGKTYDLASVEDDLTLRDVLALEVATEEVGRRWTIPQVVAAARRIGDLPKDERELDPDTLWVFAITVWASRRNAGDPVSFGDVLDIRMGDIDVIADPKDHTPKDPRRPRSGKASGRGKSAGRPRAERSTTAPASAEPSTPASS